MSVVSKESSVVLRSPGSLAAALPGLVGFTPEQSLVVVYLKEGQVEVTMRVDLPGDLGEAAEHVAQTGARVGAGEAVLIVCCARGEDALPHAEGVAAVSVACREAGTAVKDALLVDDGRYWSYLCASPTCCPPEGTLIPEDTSGLVVETVGAGRLAPAVTRAELVDRYRARPDLAPSLSARTQAEGIGELPLGERALQAWDAVRHLASPRGCDDEVEVILRTQVQTAVQDVRVRDYILTRVALAEAGTDALVDVVVRCALTSPVDLRPRIAGAAAALLAACGGSSIAVECLLDLACGESLADLVAVSVRSAVPPHILRGVFGEAFPQVLTQLDLPGTTEQQEPAE